MSALLHSIYSIYLDIAPYLFIGLTFAGVMHIALKGDFILKQLGKNDLASIIKASVLGVPLPLCSCGVVPTAMHLKRKGASNGATISFLTSTPQTGIDSIIPTFAMLGWVMGIFRPVAALIMGIFTGAITNHIKSASDPAKIEHTAQSCCLSCECNDPNCTHPSHPWNKDKPLSHSSCSCNNDLSNQNQTVLIKFLKYAYGDFIDDISTQLIIGILIAGLITWLVPDGFFLKYGGNGLLGMLLMIMVGLPMYVCATGSIPIAVSLIMKGISPGAAFVFLVVGPATNAASITVIASSLGKKITTVYLTVLTLSALFFGILLNFLINQFDLNIVVKHSAHNMHRSIFLDILTVLFSFILLLSLWRKFKPPNKKIEQPKGVIMNRFIIDDMHCNHCVKAISAALAEIPGLDDFDLNLADKSLIIKADIDPDTVISTVNNLGYHISTKED